MRENYAQKEGNMRISRAEEGGINIDFEGYTDEYVIFDDYLTVLEQELFGAGYKQGQQDARNGVWL